MKQLWNLALCLVAASLLAACTSYSNLEIRAEPGVNLKAWWPDQWSAISEDPFLSDDKGVPVFLFRQGAKVPRPERLLVVWPDGERLELWYLEDGDCYVDRGRQVVLSVRAGKKSWWLQEFTGVYYRHAWVQIPPGGEDGFFPVPHGGEEGFFPESE